MPFIAYSIVYVNSLHIKQYTHDDCGADTNSPSKSTRNKNNLFTFQQFMINNNNIHYNWHKSTKQYVVINVLGFCAFCCLEVVEHQNPSAFFKHKATLSLNCAMFGLWWCAHIQLAAITFSTEWRCLLLRCSAKIHK